MSEVEKYQRRIERERLARKEAERLLEEKSAALYEKNMELFSLSESLEKLVAQRTAEMQKARDEALLALKIKSDFIANMSHELRTPMNGVLGVLSLLQNEALTPEQSELLDVAETSGKHLLEVINDILDFSKIEANKVTIELAPIAIQAYFKQAIAPFVLQGQKKGITVGYEVDQAVEHALYTDQLRLTQIINNLVSNALKFTREGEVKLRFSKLQEGRYRLIVADTGIGISPKNLSTVFAAFEQADTSITREFGGTGLGMSITKRLVDMLGGTIHIESAVGKGTSFTLDFDMQVAQIGQKQVSAPDTPMQSNTGKRLLLVEDHKVNQMVAQRLLESWGFAVTIAENGVAATELLMQHQFDGILMDLQMPIMGGIEAAKLIRSKRLISQEIPIIAMTAHNSAEHIQECLDAGMQAHVAKPLDKHRVYAVLQEQLAVVMQDDSPSPDSEQVQIKHIDVQQSLARVGGDWAMLYALIKRFMDELTDFCALFKQTKADGMVDMGISMLHKVKGSGGNLGMNSLAKLAAQYEHDLSKHEQWPKDEEIDHIGQLITEMQEDFQTLQAPGSGKEELPKVKVSDAKLLAQISLIQNSIKQDVFAAEDALRELLTYDVDANLTNLLTDAESAMHSFHTDQVINALAQVQHILEHK